MGITLKQIWNWRKMITVEPLMFCYLIPPLILLVANENLALEKSCRVNLQRDSLICDAMMEKTKYHIACQDDTDEKSEDISTTLLPALMDSMEEWATKKYTINGTNIDFMAFQTKVCDAETESQALIASWNGIRSILASLFTVIIVLFAGGWSDKKKLRKPLMLFSMIGEFLGCLISLVSVIFWTQIPMEFARVLGTVIPAIFGGFNLMLMGCYAYITCITKEEDRTSRFGVFAIFLTILATIGASFSGELLEILGYQYLYIIANVFFVLGILQIIFILKEPNEISETSPPKNGVDNPAFDSVEMQSKPKTNLPPIDILEAVENGAEKTNNKVKTFFVEFFDPQLVVDSAKVFVEKHKNYGRTILYLCLLTLFLFNGVGAENEYINGIARIKFGWEGKEWGRFYSFGTFSALVGTAIMTNFMTKFFSISDGMIGIVGALGSCISKLLFATASTEVQYWVAQGAELFISSKAIAIRSILSKTFDEAYLGKVFSLLAIMDALVGFVTPSLYAEVYTSTLDTAPETVFYFSLIFLVPSALLFGVIYYIFEFKRKKPEVATEDIPEVSNTKF